MFLLETPIGCLWLSATCQGFPRRGPSPQWVPCASLGRRRFISKTAAPPSPGKRGSVIISATGKRYTVQHTHTDLRTPHSQLGTTQTALPLPFLGSRRRDATRGGGSGTGEPQNHPTERNPKEPKIPEYSQPIQEQNETKRLAGTHGKGRAGCPLALGILAHHKTDILALLEGASERAFEGSLGGPPFGSWGLHVSRVAFGAPGLCVGPGMVQSSQFKP